MHAKKGRKTRFTAHFDVKNPTISIYRQIHLKKNDRTNISELRFRKKK